MFCARSKCDEIWKFTPYSFAMVSSPWVKVNEGDRMYNKVLQFLV